MSEKNNTDRELASAAEVEHLSKELHEAGKQAVLAGKTVAHAHHGEKTFAFIEWADLSEAAREGRRIQARWLLDRYTITPIRGAV